MDPRQPPKLPFQPSPYARSPFPHPPPSTSTPTSTSSVAAASNVNAARNGIVAASIPPVQASFAFVSTHSTSSSALSIPTLPAHASQTQTHAQSLSPNQSPAYAVHHQLQRRPSDPPFQSLAARQSSKDSGHTRNQTSSSLPSLRDLSRTMPPPNSPPQPGGPPPQPGQQGHMMGYGPPPPRAPPVAVGPPMSFPSGRELPALSSIARTNSGGSTMSISAMLGGPPPALRESQPPPSHYPPHSAAPGSGPGFAPAIHASPRMHSAAADYHPFRRPQTPEHQRPYDPRASPQGHFSTPEVQRYGTPSAYHSRHPSNSADPGRLPHGPPPRPNSQPKMYPGIPPRPMEMGRGHGPDEAYGRREEMGRPAPGPPMDYNPERTGLRPYPYDDRYRAERERGEAEFRERERRERAYSGSDSGRHPMHPGEYGHREPPRNQPPYARPPEARDPRDIRDPRDHRDPRDPRDPREVRDPRDTRDPWVRQGPDATYRAPMDHQRPHPDYPPATGSYPPHGPAYQTAPPDRYPSVPHPPPVQNAPNGPPQPYDSPDRARMNMLHPQQQQQQQQQQQLQQQQQQQQQPPPQHRQRPNEEAPPPPPPSIAYNGAHGPAQFEPPRHRINEDPSASNGHQRNLLAIQEMNRKGRISPLPQAVQGAQLQQPGPAGEPGIKSEFGRMFAGIGNGLMGVSSPISSGAPMPFTNASLAKREDLDTTTPDSGPEIVGKPAKGRRRKLKEEDKADDDGSGRLTPASRTKRPKTHPHHHHHHRVVHHHHHPADPASAQVGGAAPFNNLKGGLPGGPSPVDKNVPVPHHHHNARPGHPHAAAAKPVQNAAPVIPPKPKTIVSSKAVLDSVAGRPRHHLGDFIYEPGLKAGRLIPSTSTHRSFASNPKPLPWDLIKDKENCTLTIKVARIHLSPVSREEITSRGYLWGTDVYTDDSDVVAACIHSGWIKGEWTEDVDSSLLDLEPGAHEGKRRKKNPISTVDLESEGLIASAPAGGPMSIPPQRDLHINILILPRLTKYSASTRYGISSREFGGDYGMRHTVHDGISYMIKSVRWVENGAQPQARLRGKARRERMRKAMWEVKGSLENISGQEREKERERIGRMRGEISGSWWTKEREGSEEKTNSGEQGPSMGGDKENRTLSAGSITPTTKAINEVQDKDVQMVDTDKAEADGKRD
ncbi:histone deacetylation protein Rxt3-domain-containing protein [Dactylonectria estremocensis]|uniref:Histone deacetylation protein Rxt3-domain-containing protein n=1 Tax=Dactylonectria estremocensis TaxID=1079267 RepID=A0A9P9F125_9HYPO|nr:histone deacetylation protein Rxt3-domain-containing protein [Dactylonectria estremocensis]